MNDLSKELCRLYSMETQSLAIIERLLTLDFPASYLGRLKEHLWNTQWQAKLVKACAELAGVNTMRSMPLPGPNRLIENCDNLESLLSFKRFEISNYQSTIAAARKAGAEDILEACQEILAHEKSMAVWLEDKTSRHMPIAGRNNEALVMQQESFYRQQKR